MGQLGHGRIEDVGDDETPAAVGPVEIGGTAVAITAGSSHTCAILAGGAVRCWGDGAAGRLGYGSTIDVGDDEAPSAAGPVALGPGRTAVAIAAGDAHTCALLNGGEVRCWGEGSGGRLGYGSTADVGDDEAPAGAGPVDLGPGRTARAISAGAAHTCAVLDDATVRCWGTGTSGRLGYGNLEAVGDDETPGDAGPVDLGPARTAVAVAAGTAHTCALLDTGAVRCWGLGSRLGYGVPTTIGDDETPGGHGPVTLATGRTARAIAAGAEHTCALLDDGALSCWGGGVVGQLGYGSPATIGDNEPVSDAGAVAVGAPMVAAVADLSLAASADAAQREVGEEARITLTLVNGGPDAAAGVAVDGALPGGLTLVGAALSHGAYDAASGRWQPGSLAPGAAATLSLTARVDVAGPHDHVAEVAASGAFDEDSVPGNAAAGEDDRATVRVTGVPAPAPPAPPAAPAPPGPPAAPAPPGPPAAPAPRVRPRPRALTLRVRPRRDRRPPLRFSVSGRLALPAGVALRPACRGRVLVTFRRGRIAVAIRRVPLRVVRGRCAYSARPTLGRRARSDRGVVRLTVRARFAGNRALAPRSARRAVVRAG